MFQPRFGVGVLDVEVVDRPIQGIAFGLRGFRSLLAGRLLALQGLDANLQRRLLAVNGGTNFPLQFADGLAQDDGRIALTFRPLPVRCCGLDSGGALGGEVDLPSLRAFFTGIPPRCRLCELLELQRRGFAVLLATIGQRQLVVPDGVGGAAALKEHKVGRDVGIWGEHALRQAHDSVQAEFLKHFLLDDGADAVAKQGAVGHDHGGAATPDRGYATQNWGTRHAQLAHDVLQKQQRGFRCLHIGRKVGLDADLFLTAEGRVGEDDVHALAVADLIDPSIQRIAVGDLGRLQPVQQQIHLHQHVRQRLGLLAVEGVLLQHAALVGRADLRRNVVVGFHQETARAAGRVEHRFAQARVAHLHHEAHHRARGVELTRVARRVAHLAQHRLVQVRQRVDLFGGAEVDTVDLVDDVAQKVTADHSVLHALEHVGNDFALAAFLANARQSAQVREQPFADTAVHTRSGFLANESQQFVAGDAIVARSPVTPAERRFDDGLVALAVELGLFFVDGLEVVEELEEHYPGEQRQPIHVTIEPLVLAQDLARRADERREVFSGGERSLGVARGTGLLFGSGCCGFGHRIGFSLLVKRGLQP